MWFKVNDHNFIGKKVDEDNGFSIFVSDLKRCCQKFVSDDELVAICQKFNPLFEAPLPKLKEMIHSLFSDNDNIEKKLVKEQNGLVLRLQSIKMNVKFQFQVMLLDSNAESVYNEFVLPILYTLIRLENRETKLVKIIHEKDVEILEYKQENCSFIRGLMATKPFQEEEFNREDILFSPTGHNFECDSKGLLSCIRALLSNLFDEKNFYSASKCELTQSRKLTPTSPVQAQEENSSHVSGLKNVIYMNHQIIKKRKKQSSIA